MASVTMEEFEALLQESFEVDTPEEGTVVKGKIIAIEAGQAIVDVGYKMEGRVDIKEFADFNSVYETKFGSHKPARSTIEVASLPLNSRVEIEAVAEISNLQE